MKYTMYEVTAGVIKVEADLTEDEIQAEMLHRFGEVTEDSDRLDAIRSLVTQKSKGYVDVPADEEPTDFGSAIEQMLEYRQDGPRWFAIEDPADPGKWLPDPAHDAPIGPLDNPAQIH